MSFEQTAYIHRVNVPDRMALQAAVDALGFDCKIDASYVPFQCSGFQPCVLAGNESGVEIYFESAAEVLSDLPDVGESVGNRDVAITFRWGGNMSEGACGLIRARPLQSHSGPLSITRTTTCCTQQSNSSRKRVQRCKRFDVAGQRRPPVNSALNSK